MKKEKVIQTVTFSFISLNDNISLNRKHALDFAKIPERICLKWFWTRSSRLIKTDEQFVISIPFRHDQKICA